MVLSLEEDFVKAVEIAKRRNRFVVLSYQEIPATELEDFIKTDRHKEYVLVCNFQNVYQAVLQTPPLKGGYLKNFIASEVSKSAPELGNFELHYQTISEVTEGRRYQEVFVFAVSTNEVMSIVSRFHQYNKKIRQIYHFALCLNHFPVPEPQSYFIYVVEFSTNKIIVLMKDGKVHFIRDSQSFEKGIHDLDIQSINMTINYFRQTMRVFPVASLLIGEVCTVYESTTNFLLPSMCVLPKDDIEAPMSVLHHYMVPILGGLSFLKNKGINLLPELYKKLNLKENLLKSYALLLLLIVLGLTASIADLILDIYHENKAITTMRAEMSDSSPVLSEFVDEKKRLETYKRLIEFFNNHCCTVNSVAHSIQTIASIKSVVDKDINLNELEIKPSNDGTIFAISGTVVEKTPLQVQRIYTHMIQELKTKTPFEIKSSKIEYKTATFNLELVKKLEEKTKQ